MFDAGGGAPAEGGGGGRGEGDLISAIFLPPGASKGGKLFFASSLLLFVRENEGSSHERGGRCGIGGRRRGRPTKAFVSRAFNYCLLVRATPAPPSFRK